ncbi:polysaccharide deacetylase family protein [Bacteroidales bacterium OttesenSCG-928-I21]|nr:polysaccharide deacetylase family protein [Bacteroidales bacterium OttesenSCG-928-I21]
MKNFFYKISSKIKILPIDFFINITHQRILFPFYHCVADVVPVHIKYLYKIKSTQEFEKDLDFLLKTYEPIDFNGFLNKTTLGANKKKKAFLLSFDDGLSEFYDVVVPILIKKGVPAICFLNSAFVDNKDLFFRFKASIIIDKLSGSNLNFSTRKEINKLLTNCNVKFDNDNSALLKINYSQRSVLDELAKIIEIDFVEYLQKYKPYLTSNQVEELIGKGFHFGAHSVDHPQYCDLSFDEQMRQTTESIEFIKNAFGLDYSLFSFPFTDENVSADFFAKIFANDNAIADLTFGTAGLKKDSARLNFQRIPLEVDNYSVRDIIYAEYYYYLLKAILGKNTIRRKFL